MDPIQNPSPTSQNLIDFLNGLQASQRKFLADINKSIETLPAIEQFEAASVFSYAIKSMQSAVQYIASEMANAERKVSDMVNAVPVIIAGDCNRMIEEKVTAGDLLKKDAAILITDANAAAQKAANDRETSVRDEIKLLATRRSELFTAKSETEPALLSREIVDKLSDEFIKADDYAAKAAKLAGRLKEVQELGVEVPQLLARAADLPLDDGGDAQFSDQLSMIKSVAGSAGGKKKESVPAPFAGSQSHANTADLAGVF
jgi:hypothetical protein